MSIDNVAWDGLRQELLILDLHASKLIYYDKEGAFVREIEQFAYHLFPRDIYVMPEGKILLYKHDHAPMEGDNHGGLWIVNPNGETDKYIIKSDFVHPTIANTTQSFLYPMEDGKIGFLSAEDPIDYIYDPFSEELTPLLAYEVKGKTVRDFAGKFNEDIRDDFLNRKVMFIRASIASFGGRTFTLWTDEQLRMFYSLYLSDTQDVIASYSLNWNLDGGFTVLPAIHPNDGYEILDFKTTNIHGVIFSHITGSTILEALKSDKINTETRKRLEEITEGMSEEDILMMNTVLQLMYMKSDK